ncbi:MAG: hypothetical protein Q7S61_02285 [bacterium]|nr:hypothetical protein [bacterium]
MSNIPARLEGLSTPEASLFQIKQTLQRINPMLRRLEEEMRKGFQLVVEGPEIPIGDKAYMTQHLGFLNITGVTSDQMHINFRSIAKGNNFDILFDGESVSIQGRVSPAEIDQAMQMLFTQDGQINHDAGSIHSNSTRNLAHYTEDGDPRNETSQPKRIP